jgi:L-fucose mutarotase/ribose pyranase (RbsD/FucU family)
LENGMSMRSKAVASIILFCLLAGCQNISSTGQSDWKMTLDRRLPEFGHRNWIVIADSAYPAQARSGIETIVTDADQLEVVKAVLAKLSLARHVRPIIYTDEELNSVPESDAPGIEDYRKQLKSILGDRSVQVIPHEQIIAKLDAAAQTFRVLILKTNMTIPYTSVFLQLDCGYWSADAEKRLRDALKK